LQKLALFCVKNANIFAKFSGENILKIITSVPDWANFRLLGHRFLLALFENYISIPNSRATFFHGKR
jgi:hypothetical protein